MAKILIVDDRPANRQYLLTLLGYGGHELLEAADGEEALRLTRSERPNLVITDILMPVMSGYEFTQQLRADKLLRSIPVIFYTASYSEPQARMLADACGVHTVLPKPCEPEKVLAVVNEVLSLETPIAIPDGAKLQVYSAADEANVAEESMAAYLHELMLIRSGFEEIAGLEATRGLSTRFSQTIAALTLLASRLSTLIQAGMTLLAERDSRQMIQFCFSTACNVVGSKYAAIGIFYSNQSQIEHVLVKGLNPRIFSEHDSDSYPLLDSVLSHGQPVTIKAEPGKVIDGLPDDHPSIRCFLGIPIVGSGRMYGWLYFADRIGADEFTKEDARIANALALELALLLENHFLYDTLQKHATALQLEIAERKRAEGEVLKLNESLERRISERTSELAAANEELEAFSYHVSHDLRSPLSAIQGFSQLLERDLANAKNSTESQKLLQHIVASSQRMTTIVNALMRLADIRRQSIHMRPVSIDQIVKDVIGQLSATTERQVTLDIQQCPDCIGDEQLLKQVFVNLLTNAFKFTRYVDTPIVTIGWSKENDAYFVRDNGAGFDMRQAERLFSAFKRLHKASEFEGTGVGLSLVQRIVRRHGGRVWAEAAVGHGACFYVQLPR